MSETQTKSEQYECSICLESIESNINKVITECGHTFHCSCIMTNIIHNGFNCPNCRAKMAEEISDDNSDSDNDNSSNWSNEDEDEDREIYEDDILRGFRMFNNLINGDEHEYEDIGDEYVYQNYVLNAYTNEDINTDEDINEDINEEPVINVDISENTDIILEDGNLEDGNLNTDINTGINLQLSEEELEHLYERNGEDYYNRINSRNDGYVFYEGGGFHHPDYLDEYTDSDSDNNFDNDYDIEFYNELYSQIFIRRNTLIGVASGAASGVASGVATNAALENGTQSLSAVLNVADDEDVRNYFRERHIVTN